MKTNVKRRFPLPTHCTSSGALATLYQGSVKVQDQRSEILHLIEQWKKREESEENLKTKKKGVFFRLIVVIP